MASPIPTHCELCGNTQKRKRLDLHHWIYEFSTDHIRKSPRLIFKNTSWLCYSCHRQIGNPIKNLIEANSENVQKLSQILPENIKTHLIWLTKSWR